MVLSLVVYWMQPQYLCQDGPTCWTKGLNKSFSSPLAGYMAVVSEHLAWCKHCRKQAIQSHPSPLWVDHGSSELQAVTQTNLPTEIPQSRVLLDIPAPLLFQYLLERDAKTEHSPTLNGETSQSHGSVIPQRPVLTRKGRLLVLPNYTSTLSAGFVSVCCSLSLYRHMNVDITMTHFLLDHWLFRGGMVGQILLLHSGNQHKFGGLGRKNNTSRTPVPHY